jgi:hypothetical protein
MSIATQEMLQHLIQRLQQVQRALGVELVAENDLDARLANQLDSMGLVEYIALLADDCGVAAERIEESVNREFGTLRELAEALGRAGLSLRGRASPQAAGAAASGRLRQPLATQHSRTRLARWRDTALAGSGSVRPGT